MVRSITCFLLFFLASWSVEISAQVVDTSVNVTDTALNHADTSTGMISSVGTETLIQKPELPDLNPLPDITPRYVSQKTWVFLFFIFVLITIGITRSINLKKHRGLLKEMTRLQISSAGFDGIITEITAVNILYLFIHCMIVGFAFYQVYTFDFINFDSGFQAFLFTLVLVIGVYVIKFYIYRIITFILDMGDGIRALISVHTTLAYVFSIVVFPLLVISYYLKSPQWSQYVMLAVGLVTVIYLLYRFVKVFITLSRFFSFPRVYLFLYLCTLEILPLLVLVNVIGLGWVR